jgi:hypothetical protein
MCKQSADIQNAREAFEGRPNRNRRGQRFVDFQETIERLPTLETRVIEWFRYLGAHGSGLVLPYTEYFDTWDENSHIQLFSGFCRHGELPLWGLRFSNIALPQFQGKERWFVNFLEMIYHCMPHDVLVVENCYELFLEWNRPKEYLPLENGWSIRLRPEKLSPSKFDPNAFRWQTFMSFREMGGTVKAPDCYKIF